MKHFIVGLIAILAVDYSIMGSDGDRSKEIIYIDFNDGTEARLVINRADLDTPKMYHAIRQIEEDKNK